MVIFYKKWKKYNEFQLTKNKMDLNIRKMTNHPPSPEFRPEVLLYQQLFDHTTYESSTVTLLIRSLRSTKYQH